MRYKEKGIMETGVRFSSEDEFLTHLFDEAQKKCKENIRDFAGYRVLIEGGGYEKVWLETQPMGGEMYGKRDLGIALDNQKIFMDHQRADGRLPGSVECRGKELIPQFDKLQGFCFPAPALDVYYLTGKDRSYLDQLYEVLEGFDSYLWSVRDSDKDGCLESWCRYDTGEDNAPRYGDAPNAWDKETPPDDRKSVPMASVDVMSYSYSARKTLAEICEIKNDTEKACLWLDRSKEVAGRLKDMLWDSSRGAFFDRNRSHERIPVLTHNTLRAMYWGSISEEDAECFVKMHLLNPEEFWTGFPLPSVAVNDPLFCNEKVNNWGGQSQALTYQRAIRALENYGYFGLIPKLGNSLFAAIGEDCRFVQQYDPFTGAPSCTGIRGEQDSYGPAILSVLEYISRMYGVHIVRDRIVWGGAQGPSTVYEQIWNGHSYRIENDGDQTFAFVDGDQVFCCERGLRTVTDTCGAVCTQESM